MTAAALLALALLQADPQPVPKSGQWGYGINVEPLYLGAVEATGAGGTAAGVTLGGALQIDLGPRLAVRAPLTLSIADAGPQSFWEAAFSPGLVYRWRSSADQHWVPYAGGGLAVGLFSFGRQLLGFELLPNSDNQFSKVGAAPELWLGVEGHPTRFLALNLSGVYSYLRVGNADLHTFRETLGLRLSF